MTIIHPAAQGSNRAFPVVAIGASAGGMQAIEELLRALDPATGMGFVILMHLEAGRKSRYSELFSTMTSMKVFEAREGTVLERNCVYVMPAGVNLTIAKGILHTSVRTESPAHNKPIDRFFHALAANSKDMAIGIVLSGGDGDGSEGCKSIEAAGGHMFIQDPRTAVNGSMPMKADETGCDDFMGSPKELALQLSRCSRELDSVPFTGDLGHRGLTHKKYSSFA